jgi:ABC-2 type transport system ATP-binding protein
MLEVTGLHKRYGDLVAVHEVSFRARPGETVGPLGPNGAGKTTPVAMIAGLLRPDRGEVRIEGDVVHGDTDPVKRKLGLVPQDLALHVELSALDNLALFGALYGMRGAPLKREMGAALELVGLADRAKDRPKVGRSRRAEKGSTGTARTRLEIDGLSPRGISFHRFSLPSLFPLQ